MKGSSVTVAVIGVGFSGTAVVAQLARSMPRGSRLLLLEQGPRWARGLAYGSCCASHWLNVPAGRLGLDPDNEGGFIQWLNRRQPGYQGADFVPRSLLGDYLGHELDEALLVARRRGVLPERLQTQVLELTREGGRWLLHLTNGSLREASQVVLATGHGAPVAPRLPGQPWAEPGLQVDPWAPGALDPIHENTDVLVLGSGLTAVDMVMALQDRGHTGRVQLLSRHGQLPREHRTLEARPQPGRPTPQVLLAQAHSGWPPRTLLRTIRLWVADAQAQGHDWRDVMASLRAITPALWAGMSEPARRQFLRHAATWWDVHRHRMAPGMARRLVAERASGRLVVTAGRLLSLDRAADGAWQARWQPRSQGGVQALAPQTGRFNVVLNCTGATTNLRNTDQALLMALRDAGWLQPDPLDLGLLLDEAYRPVSVDGTPTPDLRYIGPMLKARWWEAVAIPELRQHARAVAREVMADLAQHSVRASGRHVGRLLATQPAVSVKPL